MAGQAGPGEFPDHCDEVSVPVHWLDGAEAQARKVGFLENLADEAGKRWTWVLVCREVAAPAAKIDSGEYKFVPARRREAPHLGKDGFGRQAAGVSARLGNDAE